LYSGSPEYFGYTLICSQDGDVYEAGSAVPLVVGFVGGIGVEQSGSATRKLIDRDR
jgi:hypothetical protein